MQNFPEVVSAQGGRLGSQERPAADGALLVFLLLSSEAASLQIQLHGLGQLADFATSSSCCGPHMQRFGKWLSPQPLTAHS